ncbi:hypothetical protein DIZ48_09070 [Legionella pneumophila]|nr:hypothetical protein D7214_05835 [Legionella pneumophila]TIE26544.1 hypothetical protein DIZ48_09070 [Legionella pneumophila]TIE48064.1 hypothetical protein DIZ50_08625 [Legionella pneumophila]
MLGSLSYLTDDVSILLINYPIFLGHKAQPAFVASIILNTRRVALILAIYESEAMPYCNFKNNLLEI